ncbi:lytic transglycosylase domain-containing protein [Pseudomonas aeruginosa]|nr:lytic transglycosylase domain-containing protein [Pseudomonas aeruginosa]
MKRLLTLGLLGLLTACQPAFAADRIPTAAEQYRRTLVRSAHAGWGLSAPIATFAAQVHQESRWRADARSPVGAQGLAQFMPGTAEWIAGLYPAALGANQPFNPGWALRALVTYDRWLYDRNQASSECDRWAFVLSAYNGGQGWVIATVGWPRHPAPTSWPGSTPSSASTPGARPPTSARTATTRASSCCATSGSICGGATVCAARGISYETPAHELPGCRPGGFDHPRRYIPQLAGPARVPLFAVPRERHGKSGVARAKRKARKYRRQGGAMGIRWSPALNWF